MNKTVLGFCLFLALGWFLVAPFVGLARLNSVIESRNASALSERIDFRRVRASLGGQVISTYLKITGKDAQLGPSGAALVTGVGFSLAEPLLADLMNPEAMLDLLSGAGVAAADLPGGSRPLGGDTIDSAWQAFANAEYGIGNFYISLPTKAAPTDQFRLRLQLLQWTWKLTAIDLPEHVRATLAKELEHRTRLP